MIFRNNVDLLIKDPIRGKDPSKLSILLDVRIEIGNGKLLNGILNIAITWCYLNGNFDSCNLLSPCPHRNWYYPRPHCHRCYQFIEPDIFEDIVFDHHCAGVLIKRLAE